MPTYSDHNNPLREFLKGSNAVSNPDIQLEAFSMAYDVEFWQVDGREFVTCIHNDGKFTVFIRASRLSEPGPQISALRRYCMGDRPDLDLLGNLEGAGRAFLDCLQDLHVCTDPTCSQKICADARALRAGILSFLPSLQSKESTQNGKT